MLTCGVFSIETGTPQHRRRSHADGRFGSVLLL